MKAYRVVEDFITLSVFDLEINQSSTRNIASRAMKRDDPEYVQEDRRGGARNQGL